VVLSFCVVEADRLKTAELRRRLALSTNLMVCTPLGRVRLAKKQKALLKCFETLQVQKSSPSSFALNFITLLP
jgi:hypothetical protein